MRNLHCQYRVCPTTRTLQVSGSEPYSLLCGKNFSAGKLYNNLTESHNTLKGVIEKYNIEFTRHHKINSYVSSKVIMENSSHTFYPNHTICIVRPSRDGTRWRQHTWLWHISRLSTVCQIDTSSHHERTILQGQAEFGLC